MDRIVRDAGGATVKEEILLGAQKPPAAPPSRPETLVQVS
jgi:hypothetical protein